MTDAAKLAAAASAAANATPASPGDAGPLLRVRDLGKTFTLHLRGGLRLPVLQGLSFDLQAGECLALVGASGQGKSTLIKCLYGSYAVDSGQMHYRCADGRCVDLAQADARCWLALRRQEIGYVSQFLRSVPRVPALDVVAERALPAADDAGDAAAGETGGADALPWPQRWEAARVPARALLSRLNLPPPLWGLSPATFSGGEQQRVNIARGLLRPARLLLLDEPTASLDAANRRIVVELILAARAAGSAIVGIFHDAEVRDAVASRQLHFG